MRILIIAPKVSKPYGGPSTVAYNTLKGFIKINKELEREDIEITFLSINDKIKSKKLTDNIKIVGTKRLPPVTFTGELQALLTARKLEKPDIVHSHNLYETLPWILKKVPTIFTLHGIVWKEKMFKKSLYAKLWYYLYEKRLRAYHKKFTKFVAISPYVLEELNSKGFDTSKAVVIENPVSEEFFKVEKREEPVILYPATLIPLKNQLGFLKAISILEKELKDYRIIFAGGPKDKNYEIKLRSLAKETNLNVEFAGKVPYEKMLELYSRASIIALTSFQETTPMAVAEAMATGTPVIASRVGGIPYMIEDGETGFLVDPNNPKEIAEKLVTLLSDKHLRSKMGREGKKVAEERWKDEVIARKLLEMYFSAIEQDKNTKR
ncbi:glycosyltransferase family 4 protein [Thermococcus sp. PK]|uniref:glycosyltransferase family 4 protein n=1 Tax=Thermococcus sp. PK TaxID=913025 RepID=UPI0009FCA181|nr:glycosyltransferase family 4 protein [Thermococcus sp. PK]